MPGILDFLGLGGQEQAPPQQGLTNPALYNQAPPEFKLPFAYKLAMLGSSINRNYGGAGGMDMAAMTKGYLENQQAQWQWEQDQAERQRKLDLVQKYAEKSGNTELMELFQADPDAAVKFVFGIEAEKHKTQEPKVVGDYLVDPTGKVLFQPPAPDTSWADAPAPEGTGTAAPVAPPPDATTMTAPSAGAERAASGDIAPNAAATAQTVSIPAVAPDTTTAPVPAGIVLSPARQAQEARLKAALNTQRNMAKTGAIDANEYSDNVNAIDDDLRTLYKEEKEEQLKIQAAALEETKAKRGSLGPGEMAVQYDDKGNVIPGYTAPAAKPTSAQELEYRNTLAPEQQVAYDALRSEPSSAEKQYAYLKTLKTDEERQAFMSVLRAPAAQAVDPFDTARAKDISAQWSKYTEAAGNAQGVAADLAGMQELIKSGTLAQGVMKDPMALASSVFPWVTDPSATFASYINSVAPRMRVEGSGATSDKDYDRFVMAMPSVLNNPKANAAITSVLLARYQLIMDRAAIVDQIDDGVLSKSEGRKALRELNSRKIIPDEVKAVIDDAIKNNPKLLKQKEAEAPGGSSRINKLLDEIEGAEEP